MIDKQPPLPDWARSSSTAGMESVEPMHLLVEAALNHSEIRYVVLSDGYASGSLDFYLPMFKVFLAIEPISSQVMLDAMLDTPDVIVVQGERSIRFMVAFLGAQAAKE